MNEDENVEMLLDGEFYGVTEASTDIINEMIAKPEDFKITMHEDHGAQTFKATMYRTDQGPTLIMQRIH